MGKGQEDLAQHQKVDAYLNDFQVLYEYMYPNLSSSQFSYMKKKDAKGKFLDDGVCDVCGKTHQYVLIVPKTPKMCFKCYQTVRAYKSLIFDVLRLQRKKDLTVKDCKSIIQYMKKYSKVKLLALAALAASLTSPLAKKN